MLRVGKYNGEKVLLEGHNGVVPVTVEQINEYSQLIVWDGILTVGAKVQLSSSSAADAAAGTGARQVEIIGMDDNYNVVSEILTLNGQAYVESVNTYLRVFEVNVVSAGSGRTNAGDLYCIKTGTGGGLTGGVPATLTSGCVKVPIGYHRSTSGVFVVPAGKRAKLEYAYAGAGTQGCVFQIISRLLTAATEPFNNLFSQVVGINTGLKEDLSRHNIDILPEKTQIELKALGLAASSNVWAKVIITVF